MAGNPTNIEKNRLKIENLQISEKIFANYLRTLTSRYRSILVIFTMKSLLWEPNIEKSPYFLASVIIFAHLVNLKVIIDK